MHSTITKDILVLYGAAHAELPGPGRVRGAAAGVEYAVRCALLAGAAARWLRAARAGEGIMISSGSSCM